MNNDIFSVDPRFAGNWLNTESGVIVTVTNVVEDSSGKTILLLNNGTEITFEDFSKTYAQTDMSEEEIEQVYTTETKSGLSESAIDRLMAGFGHKVDVTQEPQQSSEVEEKITIVSQSGKNEQMVEKIFDKVDVEFGITIDVTKGEFPTKELNMLIDFFDVSYDDIVNVVYNKFISKDKLKETIHNYLETTPKTEKSTTAPKTKQKSNK